MKLTMDLPEDLLRQARRKAVDTKTSLRNILERALRSELTKMGGQPAVRHRRICWITSAGGLPPELDVSDRGKMWGWMQKERGPGRH